jgi:hypothetical protein
VAVRSISQVSAVSAPLSLSVTVRLTDGTDGNATASERAVVADGAGT